MRFLSFYRTDGAHQSIRVSQIISVLEKPNNEDDVPVTNILFQVNEAPNAWLDIDVNVSYAKVTALLNSNPVE